MGISASDTLILTAPVDWYAQTRKYVIARPTPLSASDVDYLLSLYRDAITQASMDPEFVLSQMVHETAGLTSEWSQPPKRNLAGIGVTGGLNPDGTPAGQWFPSWLDSVQTHVGCLLAMRYATSTGNAAQKRLIDFALSYRPNVVRNVGTTVADLAARWAADPEYVNKLDAVSSAIRKA